MSAIVGRSGVAPAGGEKATVRLARATVAATTAAVMRLVLMLSSWDTFIEY